MRDDTAQGSILHHEPQALHRKRRIQRNVRGSRLERGQQRNHGICASLQADAYPAVLSNSLLDEPTAQPIRIPIELFITPALACMNQSAGLRCPFYLLLKCFLDGQGSGIVFAGLIPLPHNLPPLLRTHDRQLRNGRVRTLHRALHQLLEMSQHPLDRRALKQVRVVLELTVEFSVLPHIDRQIEFCDSGIKGQFSDPETRNLKDLFRDVLKRKHHLE